MVKRNLNRFAFTLIEVLFAIMIMGITMVSVPVIMSSNNKGFETTITQEAIFAASAELNQVLALSWDDNSIENNNTTATRVINTRADCDGDRLRPGHIKQPFHRRCLDDPATTPTAEIDFDSEGGDFDDIDDINKSKKDMFLNDATTQSGYKHAYQSEFEIIYGSIDTIQTSLGHIDAKRISITVKNDQDEIVTVLRSYTLNIGEVDFYKRTY